MWYEKLTRNDKHVIGVGIMLLIVVGAIVIVTQNHAIRVTKSMAIKAECAAYNIKTGDLEWIIKK